MTTNSHTLRPVTALAAVMALGLAASSAVAQTGDRAGTLTCLGEGGWGAIITSEKTFDCTFASVNGDVRESYTGTIRKFGLDLGVTGKSALVWLVFGPETLIGGNYTEGALAGRYAGVGVEAAAGAGLGANLLLGEGEAVFNLQPVSVQVTTGLSIAAGVQTLTLDYLGPIGN